MNSLASAKNESWLSWFLRGILILLFLVLFGKLFEVQIIKGDYYRTLSEENRIRHIPIPAPRGLILSADGKVLADNVAIKKRIEFGAGGVKMTEDLTNASPDQIVTDYKRVYPLGPKFAHASGYLSLPDSDDVGKVDPLCPEKGVRTGTMLIGVLGLEKQYECELRGVPGEKLIEVDTEGNEIRILSIRPPIAGQNITTSIKFGLQEAVADAMDSSTEGKKGAAIVTDKDGRVLAFYSLPSYDPNLFIDKNNPQAISALLNNPNLPLFDRVISGTFHPGSVFKPLVALAALEEGAIDKNFLYTDTGVVTVNNFSYRNWYFTEYGGVEGQIGLIKALARSTDTFFYKIGEKVGPTNIAKWSEIFNMNKITGIDLPHETAGLVPTPEWKQKTKKESWFLGDTYNTSIGQGDVSVTPIAVNTYIQSIAANGRYCRPNFVNEPDGSDCKQLDLDQQNLDLVKDGMQAACTAGGTAYSFFDFPDKHGGSLVACKTGTAQVGTEGIPHAWFTFFAPIENPEVVVTVLFEGGGQGSSVAGTVARQIADFHFQSTGN